MHKEEIAENFIWKLDGTVDEEGVRLEMNELAALGVVFSPRTGK